MRSIAVRRALSQKMKEAAIMSQAAVPGVASARTGSSVPTDCPRIDARIAFTSLLYSVVETRMAAASTSYAAKGARRSASSTSRRVTEAAGGRMSERSWRRWRQG